MSRKLLMMLLAFALFFSGCEEKIKPGFKEGGARVKVYAETGVVLREKSPFVYECPGSIESGKSSRISSKLMGIVKAVHVKEGDQFKKGDLLVEIDDRQVKASLKQAESGLEESKKALLSAKAQLKSASAGKNLSRITYERYKKLLKEESVSAQEFDEVEARHRQAEAEYSRARSMVEAAESRMKQAEAAYESALVSAKDSLVLAPYNGRITRKMIEVGDLASPGSPLFEVETEEMFQGVFFLPENYISSVKTGDRIFVTIPSFPSSINKPVQGVIETIDPSADQRTRTFKVKVDLESGYDFSSGVFARGFFPVGEKFMIMILKSAIQQNGQLTSIYVVDSQNIAHLRLVKTGVMTKPGYVEILSGLNPGERYVKVISEDIKDGVVVEEKS